MSRPGRLRIASTSTVWTLSVSILLLSGMVAATPVSGPAISQTDTESTEYATVAHAEGSPNETGMVSGRTGRDSGWAAVRSGVAGDRRSGTAVNVSYAVRRLPERPGIVGVRMRLPRTPAVDSVAVAFREEVTVVDTTAITRNGSSYEWNGERAAEIAYRVPINWTYTGNRGPTWTLVRFRRPSIDAGASVEVRHRVQVVGEGYVGNRTVLLGDHEVYERQADGQQLRVVVPENVTLRYGPRRTVGDLASAARSLSVGARDRVVHAFVTPQILTEATQLFQPGFSLGDNTLLIDGESEFDVWTHEYVHSRQQFPDTGQLRWLTEGSAEYYGWLLSIELGYDDWAQLRRVFTRGRNDDSVLADPDTWQGETQYNKGALVLGVLDHEIRTATGGERTLQEVIRRVNSESDPTLRTFLQAVREVGGPDAAAAAKRYVTTSAAPDYRPDAERFAEIYDFATSSGPNASPKVRTRILELSTGRGNDTESLDPGARRVELRTGQSIRIRGRVTNAGNAGGLASLAVRRSPDGADTERRKTPWVGWVRPGESVERSETIQFNRSGRYEIAWGDWQYTVSVVADRGTASVTRVNATLNRTTDRVLVEASVRNDGDRPTLVDLPVTLDGQQVRTIRATVDGRATRTISLSVNVSGTVPYNVSVGNASVTIGEKQPADRSGSGFEIPIIPVLGVLGVLVLLGGLVLLTVDRE